MSEFEKQFPKPEGIISDSMYYEYQAKKQSWLAALKWAKNVGHLYAKDTEVEEIIQQEIAANE